MTKRLGYVLAFQNDCSQGNDVYLFFLVCFEGVVVFLKLHYFRSTCYVVIRIYFKRENVNKGLKLPGIFISHYLEFHPLCFS